MPLPEHVHKTTSKGYVYYTYQRDRNTINAGPRTRIPHEPGTVEFYEMYERLHNSGATVDAGTINELVKQYENASPKYKALSKSSRRVYDIYLKLFCQRLGKYQVHEVKPVVIQALYDSIAHDTPSTARQVMSIIRAVYKFGIPRGLAETNPAIDIDAVKLTPNGAKPWPQWAFEAVNHTRWQIKVFVFLGLYTGQRTSDIVKMKLSDIRGNEIQVTQQKTGKKLWVTIHKNLLPIIIECRQRGVMYMLHNDNGEPFNTASFRSLYVRCCEGGSRVVRNRLTTVNPMIGFQKAEIKPHGLRKSAVVALRESGVSEEDTGLIVGMSNQMVKHYSKGWNQRSRTQEGIRKWETVGR